MNDSKLSSKEKYFPEPSEEYFAQIRVNILLTLTAILAALTPFCFAMEGGSVFHSEPYNGVQRGSFVSFIELNSAGLGELTALPNIGPVIGARILELREERGGFKTPEELLDVKGIGPKTYDKIKDVVYVETNPSQ